MDEVNNSSVVSHIEMNFQNQESKPSGRNLDSQDGNSIGPNGQPRNHLANGHPRGNMDQEDDSFQSDDDRNRMSYMVSNQDGRPQSSIAQNPYD